MSALDKIRQAFPDLSNASDSELLGEISKLTGNPYESVATTLGVAPRGTMAETARQFGAGIAVDLPRMVGQGLQYTGIAPEAGRALVSGAEERAPGWTPDMRGRGLLGEALVTGARAIGPMAPAIAASFVPGGQFVAPTVAAGLFGTSSAQETLEKLRAQGVPEEDAIAAARRVGLVQGPLEGVATAAGLRAFRAAKPLVGLGGTTAGVASRLTDTAVLKPFAKGMGINLAVQPSTEVAQDVGTEMIERSYGAAPEDIGDIARSSALGGVGLTLLLGPLALGGHVARANRAEKLKEALYSPDTPTEIRAQALDLVMGEARRQNIPEANVDQWFEQQLTMEDARNAELAKLEEEQRIGERDLLVTEEAPIQQRIDQNLGLTRKEDRKGYEKQFEEAFTEGTGQRVADATTGVERELTAGELIQRNLPQDLTVAVTEDTKPTAPSIFSELDTTLNKLGIKPTKNSRGIYEYMVAEGIDPKSQEAEKVLNALADSKLGDARKAVAEIIRARSPRGTGISTVQQPAGGVGAGSPVVQGTVGDAGRVAPVAGAVDGGAPAAGAPLQQAGILSVAPGQPSTPITTGAPSGTQASQTIQTAPQGQTTTTRGAAGTTALVDTSDDALEIARATGNASEIEAMREEEAGLRVDQRDFTEADLNELIDEQLGKGKNKERDRKIMRAYILSRRMETEGAKGDLVEEIASTFDITEDRVRQIGNPEKLARLAVDKGFDSNQVFALLGIESAQKKVATKLGKLEGELARLKKKAKPTKADIARMAELDEQVTRINDEVEAGDMAAAFKEAGIEGEAGEAFGNLDDAREWQKASTAGSQMAVRLVSIADTMAELKSAAAELKQLGLAQAEAAATARIQELTAEYQAIVSGYEAKPEAEATAPKKGKGKGKAAEKAAEEKDAAKEAEAAKFRAERAAKLEADRKGLAVGDTVMNPKLGTGVVKSFAGDGDATTVTVAFQSGQTKELSVKLAKLEKTNAVQVESAASVPVQPKAETGQGVGTKVRRVKKPAAESKAAAPAVILTQAEQAAQAWDKVAADFPEAPKFADLTKAQQNNFIGFGEGNWERGDVELELTKLARTSKAVVPWSNVALTTKGDVEVVPTASLDGVDQRNKADTTTPEYKALKASIQAKGIVNPIILTTNSLGKAEVFEGNHRLQVARELGLAEVPVVLHSRTNQSESYPVVGRKPSSVLPKIGREPVTIDVEARVVEETIAPQIAKLPAPQVTRLENHYNAKQGTPEFLAKVKADVVLYATKGAEAVAGAIRDIIKSIHAGVLSVAMIFNPTAVSQIEAFVVIPQETQTTTQQVLAELPAEVKGMSEAGKQAYATLIPALKGKIGDKFVTIADKPSGRIFVFKANGDLVLQKKALFGLAKGDLYKGNNDLKQNRVTPAGLFGINVVDAAKGGDAAVTAGEYDFGKVFALDDPDATVTFMHSVWLKESDGPKRAAALKNDSAADSRYSFGCINVDKETFKDMVGKYSNQMDGSKLFVVPDVQSTVNDFITGNVANDRLVREGVQPVTKTTTTPVKSATKTAGVDRTMAAKEEEVGGMKFGKDAAVAENPYTASELLADIKDFIRADVPGRKLVIVDSINDLLNSGTLSQREVGAALQLEGAYGVAKDGVAYLVADRIQKGEGRAKFMHEVGSHLGLENLLPKATYNQLVNQIEQWAGSDNGSLESQLAAKAKSRVGYAKTPTADQRDELLAYFVEEAMLAGVDPTASTKESGPLTNWFRTLWAAFKIAIRKLGFKPETLMARDVVNMAFGAARLEMNGSWHGTAAQFRKFNHAFMSSGEGAQAYGWGTYLAQSVGIAKAYWSADTARKEKLNVQNTLRQYVGWRVAETILHPVDRHTIVSANSKITETANLVEMVKLDWSKFTTPYALAGDLLDVGVDQIKLISPKGKTITVKLEAPAGSLMRLDTAVTDDELLDWDASFADQPDVVRNFVKQEAANIKAVREAGANIQITSGADILRYLIARFYKDTGLKGPWADAEPELKTRVKEQASKYMQARGVKGIRFFDADSRDSTLDNISFTKNGKTVSGRDGVLNAYFTPGAIVQGYGGPDKVVKYDPVKEVVTVIAVDNNGNPRRGERERTHFTMPSVKEVGLAMQQRGYDLGASNRTRNLVIFNENDIFRAGSQVGADRQRMKFGKNAVSQGLIDRNIAKLPKQSQQPVKNLTAAIGDLGGKYLDYAVFTNDLVKRAQALGLGAAKTFSDRLAARNAKVSEEERKIEKIADRYASIEDDAKGSGPGSVNEFLFESTRTGKWGYGKFRDAKMGAAFDKLGPKAQQFVKDVFAHGDATLSNKKKIVLEATNSEYDAMIKAAQDAGDTKTEATLKAEKAATLKRFQTLFRIREGMPYAPIKRTGAYVVIGESAAYKAAKAKNDTATVKKLESDPDHYHVSFVDTKWQARNLSDKLSEQGVFDSPQIVKRSESFDEAFSGEAMLPALTKMRAAVDRRSQDATGKKDPTAGKLLNIINQLYLEALAEGSARKSEMRRRGVAGEVDMLQSFTQQGRADANFLASVEFEPKIQDALQQMRNQSRTGDRERKSEVFNELTQRYADSLEPKDNPFINGLTNMASKFFLASSPGYYLQNLTQPFMMSLPAMAGRHDYTKAAAELAKAYTELGPLFKDVKLFDEQFDFSKVPADVRDAINELVNQGKIDIGLATEINEYKVEADGNLSKFAQRLNKGMRMAVQKVEATNRLSTAIAAYRLEFAKTKDAAKATQYAADILTDTHGDYTAFNAPRVFNTQWGKVALQFRKFQLIQIAFYTKLIRDAFTKPDERAAALKTLGYSLGHTAVFAGMMGLPGYAAISAILSAFGDEDEPYDLTAEMRKALGPEWADIIMRGAPTVVGMDLSGKIGAGNMLSIMPFSNADLSTNAGRAEAFGTLMGGAALGMSSRIIDGLGLILGGDYYKGVERVMPKGVSDALKAGRQAAEGMTRRNGDVILPDSEIGAIDTVLTGLGVPAVKQAVTYERQNRMRDVTENFNDRTTRIKNDYAKAVREKDTAAMAEARAAWTKLQQTRQRNGLKPQPISNLLKAPQEQKAREKRTVGGVSYRQGQQKLAESIAEN